MARYCLLLFLLVRLYADQFDGVRDSIRRQLVETQSPSIAVAVAKDGGGSSGEQRLGPGRSREANRRRRAHHVLAGLYLEADHRYWPHDASGGRKINLDHPVNEYPGNAGGPRRRRCRLSLARRVITFVGSAAALSVFYADEPTASVHGRNDPSYGVGYGPWRKYEYSNLGFGIIDYAIARVSGKPGEDFMREEVFVARPHAHFGRHRSWLER
jgi:hypothetical protein